MDRKSGRSPRPSLLAAPVGGFAAVFVLMALRQSGERLLQALARDVAAGRREPVDEAEVRRTWQAITEAAEAYLTWSNSRARQGICGSSPEEPESWLTVKQAAARLGLSERRVRQLLADGHLAGVRDARGWRVDPVGVELRRAS